MCEPQVKFCALAEPIMQRQSTFGRIQGDPKQCRCWDTRKVCTLKPHHLENAKPLKVVGQREDPQRQLL
jgi:hypothetical protein